MDSENKKLRALLKLSGEALMGGEKFGIDISSVKRISADIKAALEENVELSIVVGGGNIYRGVEASAQGMERATADNMGMLATIINALCLQNNLELLGIQTRVLSAIPMATISEPYIRRKAVRHMEKGRVVIFAAGTGNPYFTTDSAAVLRAIEMNCDVLLKGTQVDGVYDKDPKNYTDAKKFSNINYTEVLKDNLNVMDMAAIALARENNLPIKVFSIKDEGSLAKVIKDEGNFTSIKGK